MYKVGFESNEFLPINGVYVETNIKDTLVLGDIGLRFVEIKNTDTVSVDLYYLEDGKENIIHNFLNLDNIHLDSFQSYIEIDNLSDYFDKMYLRVTIIDKNNKVKKYETKLKFTKDFSNNTLYIKDEENMDNFNKFVVIKKSPEEIQNILLENGFLQNPKNVFSKVKDNLYVRYFSDLNRIILFNKSKNLKMTYTYNLDNNILKILIVDNNNVELENYSYNIEKDVIDECVIGSCNNYEEVLDTMQKNILYLFE